MFRYRMFYTKHQVLLNDVMLAYTRQHKLQEELLLLDDMDYLEYEIKRRLSYSYADEHVFLFE